MSKWERDKSTFALSKIYNVNFSLFDRLLIKSGQLTQISKKVTNRGGPSILDVLYDQKKSHRPVLMGIEKFVFVFEHKMGRSDVSFQNGNFPLFQFIELTAHGVHSRPSNSNRILYWLCATISSSKAMIPVTSP